MNITPRPEESNAVVVLSTDDIRATITPSASDFELSWNDHVANNWTEIHHNLPAALTRLAEIVA